MTQTGNLANAGKQTLDAERENEVRGGPQDRIVIPASLRKALKLKSGDRLIIRKEDDKPVPGWRGPVEKRLWEVLPLLKPSSRTDCLPRQVRQEWRKRLGRQR